MWLYNAVFPSAVEAAWPIRHLSCHQPKYGVLTFLSLLAMSRDWDPPNRAGSAEAASRPDRPPSHEYGMNDAIMRGYERGRAGDSGSDGVEKNELGERGKWKE